MRYEHNNFYFNPVGKKKAIVEWSVMVFWGAICSAGFILDGSIIFAIIGVIVVLIGVLGIRAKSKSNKNRTIVTDDEIDSICAEYISNLKSMALDKLGIDESQVAVTSPIQFCGYHYLDLQDSPSMPGNLPADHEKHHSKVRYMRGADGIFRSSNYNAVIFFFSTEKVYCYKICFSILKDEKYEKTYDFSYKDIVSVSTESGKTTYDSETTKFEYIKAYNSETIQFEFFKLTTSGETCVEATIFSKEDTERNINSMKNLLKSKE